MKNAKTGNPEIQKRFSQALLMRQRFGLLQYRR
jgi:hypothetical protein